ncbi:hypothetical protein BS47DRAFT_1297100, partial [Hydnum rufescens UP504]
RNNIAPRTYAPVVRRDGADVIIQSMRWGVVPHFQKFDDGSLKTINARGEHLTDGTSSLWNSLKGKKRALVPVHGYFEWLKAGNDKVPHFTRYKEEKVMMLAGLWDVVHLEDSKEPLYTFTIVTTSSSKQLSFLHDRMPVVLSSKEDIELWLNSEEWSKEVSRLITPSTVSFECYAVPKEVGKVGTDSPSFVLPISKRKDGIDALFSKQREKAKKRPTPASETSPNPSPTVREGKRKAVEKNDNETKTSTKLASSSSSVSALARDPENVNLLDPGLDDSSSDIVEIPNPSPPPKKKAKINRGR